MTFEQPKTWCLIANTNACRIYQTDDTPHHFSFIKELYHPENKLRDSDLTSDKPGHYKTSTATKGVYAQRSDPKEVMVDDFARSIAEELDKGRKSHDYERLIMVAPAHMNGLIAQHINKHVCQLIRNNVKQDVMHLKEQELFDFLHKQMIPD